MSQNSERLVWTAEEVDARLHQIMNTIYNNCKDAAARNGLGYNLVAGATSLVSNALPTQCSLKAYSKNILQHKKYCAA